MKRKKLLSLCDGKINMKFLFAILFLIPSLGWGKYHDAISQLYNGCEYSDEYIKWDKKNESIWKKREVYLAKCILDYAKNSSSVPFYAIEESCEVLSKDKYKTKGEEPEKCKK